MASNNYSNHYNNNIGSRLAGSSWTPSSSNPYNTNTPNSNNNGNNNSSNNIRDGGIGGTYNHHHPPQPTPSPQSSLRSGGSNTGGPTPDSLPNSLDEPRSSKVPGERHVQWSRAEYKAPNSLQNSLDSDYGGGAKTPNSLMDNSMGTNGSPAMSNASSLDQSPPEVDVRDDSRFRGGFQKSYVERYRDVKQMPSSSGYNHARKGSRSTGRTHNITDLSPHTPSPSATGIGGGDGYISVSLERRGRYANEEQLELDERYNDDDASERTPLERWESRKERKMMEKGIDYNTNNRSSPLPQQQHQQQHQQPTTSRVAVSNARSKVSLPPPPPRAAPAVTTPTQRASHRASKDRATRWSPIEEEEEENDEGYEEYDDFGARSTRNPDGSSSRQRSTRGHSSDRSTRYHGRKEDRRPDPMGHRQSSLREANNINNNNHNEGSPLYDDVDDHNGAGNIHVGERSPLSIDHHFDRSPKGASPMRPNKASPQKASPRGGGTTTSSVDHRGQQRHGDKGRDRPRSTYADDLRSFTESVTSSVASVTSVASSPHVNDNNGDRQQQQPNQQGHNNPVRNHNGQQYSQMGQLNSRHPNGTVPVSYPPPPSMTSSSHTASPGLHDGYPETRVRHRASDFCERVTGCYRRSNSLNSLDKAKKKYLCITLFVCAICVIAAGVTIYFLGTQREVVKENTTPVLDGWDGLGDDVDELPDVQVDEIETTDASTTSAPAVKIVNHVPTTPPTLGPIDDPTYKPTARPTTQRERLIGEFLHALSPQSSKEGTPQHRAKLWLVHEDGLNLQLPRTTTSWGADDEGGAWHSELASRIEQRFALATCYYSMGIGEGGVAKGWLEGEECRDDMGDYGTAWDGVGCDEDGKVRALALDGASLHGTIPPELALLTSVENLVLKNNPGLVGRIPNLLGVGLTQLRQLGLYGNTLTGTVPKSIFRLRHLVYLNLADNTLMGTIHWGELGHHQKHLRRLMLQNNFFEGTVDYHLLAKTTVGVMALSNNAFSGHVDDTVRKLTSLEYLYLDGNKIVGSIPDGMTELSNLKALNLDENELYGTLPQAIGQMTSLEYLSAKGNTLSGGLPASMKHMKGLKTLNLASNALSGRIGHLSDMAGLENVHLYQNSFSGPIDGSIFASLLNLEAIFLSSNSFTGRIPPEVVQVQKKLKGLYLSDNELDGIIPEGVCALYKLEDLYLDSNALEGTLPSCLGNLSSLKRFHVFKNQIHGNVPTGLLNLPHLIELGLEENDLRGGMDGQATCRAPKKGLSIWADCAELDGGCECCEKCCLDKDKNC